MAPARARRAGPRPRGAWPPGPRSASAYVSPAQAEHAAERGANWFQANQEASGNLGSDWGDDRPGRGGHQRRRRQHLAASTPAPRTSTWTNGKPSGPGGAGTDAARGILTGVAGGIQPSRLSTSSDATKSNLVARIAELFDGNQIGEPGLLNDDIFGVLALHQAGAPQPMLRRIVDYLRTKQQPDGGWSWNTSPGAPADTDMTGSVVAAFCAAGVGVGRSRPAAGRSTCCTRLQDPATGGFIAPPESFGIGVNTDTTSWVTSGLIQCGIDPQGPEWTTAQGKTPLDYLVSLQRPDGHFDWTDEFAGGAFETYDSVRPLGGIGFSTAPPARLDGVSPAVRPAPPVAAGTTVPITLVIDHGPGADDVRMCRVDIEIGLQPRDGAGRCQGGVDARRVRRRIHRGRRRCRRLLARRRRGDTRVRVAGPGRRWPHCSSEASEPIGFGDLVFLRFAAKVANPGVGAAGRGAAGEARRSDTAATGPRVAVLRQGPVARDGVAVRLGCPRGNGAGRLPRHADDPVPRPRGAELALGGSAPFEVASGSTPHRHRPAGRARCAQVLAERPRVKLRLTAATRDEDGRGATHPRQAIPQPVSRRLATLAATVALATVAAAAVPGRGGRRRRCESKAQKRRRRSSTAASTRCPTPSTAATAAAPIPARARRERFRRRPRPGALDDALRGAGHLLARQLEPELPRLLHRQDRALRLAIARPLLVIDASTDASRPEAA